MHIYLTGCFVATVLHMLIMGNQRADRFDIASCGVMVLLSWISVAIYSVIGMIGLVAPEKLLGMLDYLNKQSEKLGNRDEKE